MPIILKKHFTWREPREFLAAQREQEKKSERWWMRLAAGVTFGILFTAMLLPIRCLKQMHPSPGAEAPISLLESFLLGIVLGVFLMWIVPWLSARSPSTIAISDGVIRRTQGQHRFFKIANYHSFFWRSGSEFTTLVLNHRRRGRLLIGVPNDFQRDPLSTFLCVRGLANDLNT